MNFFLDFLKWKTGKKESLLLFYTRERFRKTKTNYFEKTKLHDKSREFLDMKSCKASKNGRFLDYMKTNQNIS